MPCPPSREPNGRTYWFGAELKPDGSQLWFRTTLAAVHRIPALAEDVDLEAVELRPSSRSGVIQVMRASTKHAPRVWDVRRCGGRARGAEGGALPEYGPVRAAVVGPGRSSGG